MLDRIFIVQYITSKTCFLYLSLNNLKEFQGNLVKLMHGNTRTAYFSIGSPTFPIREDCVGISSLYAKALDIKENEAVTLTKLVQLPTIKSLSISPLSQDDYDVLEMLALDIQSTLLSQIRVLNNEQKIVIWVGNTIHVVVDVCEVDPISPGRIDNFTEVAIKNSVKTKTNSEPKQSNKITSIFNFFWNAPQEKMIEKPVNIIKKFIDERPSNLILRALPLGNYIKQNNELNYIFTVFISKTSNAILNTKNSKQHPQIYLATLLTCPENSQEEKSLYIRVYFIEDFFQITINIENDRILISDDVYYSYFNCDIGSRILLEPFNGHTPIVEEIEIMPNKNVPDLIEILKKFMADRCLNDEFVLNPKFIIDLDDTLRISVNFRDKFCLITQDFIRNCKIQIGEVEMVPSQKKIASVSTIPNFLLNVSNYQNIVDEVLFIFLNNTKVYKNMEHVLIEGPSGTGKTTLLKIIDNRLKSFPNYVFTKIVNCKSIKGKTIESLHKHFVNILFSLVHHQPSILILDNLHTLCQNANEADAHLQNIVYYDRISEMLDGLFQMFFKSNSIGILATTSFPSKLNKNIYGTRGHQLFKNIYKIEELSGNDRFNILKYLFHDFTNNDDEVEEIAERTQNFVFGDLVNFANKTHFEIMQLEQPLQVITLPVMEKALESTTISFLHGVKLNPPGTKDFSDIGGLEEVKTILIETLLWPSKYPNLFSGSPLRLPSGLLLYGPPGTGKTLLAGAAAKHCRLRLISIKGPELLSKYIGASEQAVRDVFEKAQSAKPCLLFFDEFDSLAPRRGHDNTGVTDRVVNQLLTQLDGVETLSGVFVLAATSRPDLLDPALLRPGRLDRHIFCDLPDEKARFQILQVLSKSMKFDKDVALDKIAEKSEGFSGADLQSVLYSAQLNAVEKLISSENYTDDDDIPKIDHSQLEHAFSNTRPSLSPRERLNYKRRYQKFKGGTVDDLKTGTRATLA